MTKELFVRLNRHAVWANRRVLDLLSGQVPVSAEARRLFSHILAAEQLWLARIRGEDYSSIPIWPALSLDDCRSLAEQNQASYDRFLSELTDEDLSREVTYKNSKGLEFSTSIRDILTHVSLHGTNHRGQIAAALRAAAVEPVNTDFITFVREQP